MDISIAKAGIWTVISASGEIDLHQSPALRVEIIRHLDAGESVLLDMADVGYIDSSGIAVLVQALSHARKLGLDFGLVHPTEPVMRILRLTHLDHYFSMYDSVQAAPGA